MWFVFFEWGHRLAVKNTGLIIGDDQAWHVYCIVYAAADDTAVDRLSEGGSFLKPSGLPDAGGLAVRSR